MRTAKLGLSSPNYQNPRDSELLRFGRPDMLVIAHGIKLYVHSKICAPYSAHFQQQVLHPDPIYGRMTVITGNRSTEAMVAVLDAIYPPQRAPEPQHLFECCEIAQDYDMELLLQKIKLGIVQRASLEGILEAIQLMDVKGQTKIPEIIYEALGEQVDYQTVLWESKTTNLLSQLILEMINLLKVKFTPQGLSNNILRFTLAELTHLPHYNDFDIEVKLTISKKREQILERLLQEQPSLKKIYEFNKPVLFQEIPEGEAAENVGQRSLNVGLALGKFMRAGGVRAKRRSEEQIALENGV